MISAASTRPYEPAPMSSRTCSKTAAFPTCWSRRSHYKVTFQLSGGCNKACSCNAAPMASFHSCSHLEEYSSSAQEYETLFATQGLQASVASLGSIAPAWFPSRGILRRRRKDLKTMARSFRAAVGLQFQLVRRSGFGVRYSHIIALTKLERNEREAGLSSIAGVVGLIGA